MCTGPLVLEAHIEVVSQDVLDECAFGRARPIAASDPAWVVHDWLTLCVDSAGVGQVLLVVCWLEGLGVLDAGGVDATGLAATQGALRHPCGSEGLFRCVLGCVFGVFGRVFVC